MITSQHILFHALKHHLPAIADFIRQGKIRPFTESLTLVKTMGASRFDLYTGALSVEAITAGTAAQLNASGVISERNYRDWISENSGYQVIRLSDGSEWTLRYVNKPAFVHLHPSRYALHTVRIKANAMKTVCCYFLLQGWHEAAPDREMLNNIRTTWLHLSPISLRDGNEEIIKVYTLVRNGLGIYS